MGKPGRPKGSTSRPQLKDYITLVELRELVDSAKLKAKEGDTNLMKFILEQVFGKAIQPVDTKHSGTLILEFDASLTPPKTKGDS